ncbi:protein of unknown function [Nitrospira japonica]|uniref:Uncharacterized protein n=1 Tax=Nitrospira japonica TaxID=1325564 RepID=A0A1W1I5H2_9BACT|nr:protein of unknown function [Nitrospira japonica]
MFISAPGIIPLFDLVAQPYNTVVADPAMPGRERVFHESEEGESNEPISMPGCLCLCAVQCRYVGIGTGCHLAPRRSPPESR